MARLVGGLDDAPPSAGQCHESEATHYAIHCRTVALSELFGGIAAGFDFLADDGQYVLVGRLLAFAGNLKLQNPIFGEKRLLSVWIYFTSYFHAFCIVTQNQNVAV